MSELEKLTDKQIEELVVWIEDHKEVDQETLRYINEMVVTIEKCRELNRELPKWCVGFDQMDVEEYSQTMSVLRDIRELYSDSWRFGSESAAMYIEKLKAMYPEKYKYLASQWLAGNPLEKGGNLSAQGNAPYDMKAIIKKKIIMQKTSPCIRSETLMFMTGGRASTIYRDIDADRKNDAELR